MQHAQYSAVYMLPYNTILVPVSDVHVYVHQSCSLTHDSEICSIYATHLKEPLTTTKRSVDIVCEGAISRILYRRVPRHRYGVV